MQTPVPRRASKAFSDRMKRAVARRRIFPYLVLMTTGLALIAGFVATLVDREAFPTFGTGVWWAIVTLGTVGYGDVVPHTAWGRVVGGAVIVVGVTFLSFLIAIVTSLFVSSEQEEKAESERARRTAELDSVVETLGRIERRLDDIETRLRELT